MLLALLGIDSKMRLLFLKNGLEVIFCYLGGLAIALGGQMVVFWERC